MTKRYVPCGNKNLIDRPIELYSNTHPYAGMHKSNMQVLVPKESYDVLIRLLVKMLVSLT